MLLPQPRKRVFRSSIVREGVFGDEECAKIVELGNNLMEATVGATVGAPKVDENIRKSKVQWLPKDQAFFWIYKKLSDVAIAANSEIFNFHLSGLGEQIQLTKYESKDKGFYDWHQDIGPGDMSVRKLSMVVLLSDEKSFQGGDLELFTDKSRVISLKKGDVVCFPSYESHRVTELVEGERWSLVSWVSGPPFA